MSKLPPLPRLLRWITGKVLGGLLRVRVEEVSNLPAMGPFILVWNHLHMSDAMLLFSTLPRPVTFLATDKFRWRNPIIHYYMKWAGAILVGQGRSSLRGVRAALAALALGTPIALAPEGRVSPTGALCAAEPGVASLVRHSGVAVVPVAVWGQYKAHRWWRRLRRPEVTIRFGPPLDFAHLAFPTTDLQSLTTEIMTALAMELPPAYRGVYGEFCARKEQASCA